MSLRTNQSTSDNQVKYTTKVVEDAIDGEGKVVYRIGKVEEERKGEVLISATRAVRDPLFLL